MILTLVIVGFALLGAGTYRQSEQLFGRLPPFRTRLTLLGAGYAVLALSLLLVIAGEDVGRQLVQWFGMLTVGALVMLIGCWIRCERLERARAQKASAGAHRRQTRASHASEKPKGVLVRR